MIARWMVMGAALATVSCNQLLGADEPRVDDTPPEDVDGNSSEPVDGDGTDPPPPPPTCGDGEIQVPEECDDGNDADDDGCAGCVVPCGEAPEFKIPVNDHCYLILAVPAEPQAWDGAEEACEAWGGHLASVGSLDEYAFIQQRVTHDVWMGARREGDTFVWVDGEPWLEQLALWAPGEPADAECVRFSADYLGFATADCEELVGYVCERFPHAPGP